MSNLASAFLVVGLGNPGAQYDCTRHNMGFMSIDFFKDEVAVSAPWKKKNEALSCEAELAGNRLFLLKPQTFMNLSGRAVVDFQRFYKIPFDRLIVIHDDLDLAFGRLNIKVGGGDAGHNGLKSIRLELGSGEYLRVRCGIGRPVSKDGQAACDIVSWVLKRFIGHDREIAENMAKQAAEAVKVICQVGFQKAQQSFNGRDFVSK